MNVQTQTQESNPFWDMSSFRIRENIKYWKKTRELNCTSRRPIDKLDTLASKRIAQAEQVLFSRDLP